MSQQQQKPPKSILKSPTGPPFDVSPSSAVIAQTKHTPNIAEPVPTLKKTISFQEDLLARDLETGEYVPQTSVFSSSKEYVAFVRKSRVRRLMEDDPEWVKNENLLKAFDLANKKFEETMKALDEKKNIKQGEGK